MTALIEFREAIREFYSKYDTYILALWKFLLALSSFLMINAKMGYFSKLDNIFIVLILALFCSFLPINGMLLFSGLLVLAHLYALSIPALAVGGGILLIVVLLYFGTVPEQGYILALTILAVAFGIPSLIPLTFGLIAGPFSMLAMCFGTIAYYAIFSVNHGAWEAVMENGTAAQESQAMAEGIKQMLKVILTEQKLVLTLIALVAVFLVVYLIRRMSIRNAWTLAICMGVLAFFIIDVVGSLILGNMDGLLWLILGTFLSAGIAFCVKFMLFQVDYSRTMKVQFEDDDYYYYVKAVPKLKKGREKSGEY